ncbi:MULTISPECIES: glutamate--cysteine ligase [unclassified Duganella]|uniref:glutamate--cysteine ligase n=1 Tax=unclassified Duganella TaxID=2636909 RepID=UPI00088C7D14|nr:MULTISPECIES: glutamate--cysteine ligase [unclassified Duganella]SDG92458.1 glutamate-cysteine ligase [Duganella sp. OV458]SDJ49927.1 glutamate-cysteine ligase [Duganella sp. OV510]
MPTLLTRRLALLAEEKHRAVLAGGLRGIERETLRVDGAGHLAHTPHPAAMGSALTHPQITTDYAETLLEFITPAEQDIATTLAKLDGIHRYAYSKLGNELLWSQSMPCQLPAEEDIEIAWYGTSNLGTLKHVYRRGLALRYGKAMQCIAGIHYNYSLDERLWRVLAEQEPGDKRLTARSYQSEAYLATIRNFRRYSWLLMYLFGASPVLSSGFLRGRPHKLQTLSADTLYLPYATSLRMSDLGYQNDAQSGLSPHENCLDSYVAALTRAVNQPYAPYAELGTKRDGEWIQLSTNVLQIENEYYSTIRPKRVIQTGERPIQALCARGVQYIEVRCMDVDPFEPVGISEQAGRFLDAFLLFCALEDSPQITPEHSARYTENFARTVKEGRRPGLTLHNGDAEVPLPAWGAELLERIRPVAELLDTLRGDTAHGNALAAQSLKLQDATLTPSAQVLRALEAHGNSFSAFALAQSEQHAAYFRSHPPTAEEASYFDALAATSLAEQGEMEAAPQSNFDDYVAAYRASNLCQSRQDCD